MSKILIIAKKELQSYFLSTIAYVVLTIFLVTAGFFFFAMSASFSEYSQAFQSRKMQTPQMSEQHLNLTESVFRGVYHNLSTLMLFFLPLLTMKLFSDERRVGTIELLFSYPIRDVDVLLGKFLAAFTMFFIMISVTLLYPVQLILVGGRLEAGPIAASYIGLLLLGGAFLSMGLFFSSLTENQIVAASLTFTSLLIFWIIGWVSNITPANIGDVLKNLSLLEHFANFAKGIFNSKDIIYYLSFTFFFGFLTLNVLETKV